MSRDRIYVRDENGNLRIGWTENVPGGNAEGSPGSWRGEMAVGVSSAEQNRRTTAIRAEKVKEYARAYRERQREQRAS